MRNVRLFVLALTAAAALMLAVIGCTSENPTEVGDSLTTARVDSVLVPLRVETILRNGQQLVTDDSRPYVEQDVLYLGEQEGTASAFLVNFDFSDPALVQNDSINPGMLTEENITPPNLRLNMIWFYRTVPRPDSSDSVTFGLRKYYEVYRLLEPFDTTAEWPGAIPPHDGIRLNANAIPDLGESWIIEIELKKPDFISWVEAGDSVGFLIQEGPAPPVLIDPGMVGFSSRDNRFPASTIGAPAERPVTVRYPGPTLRCKFVAEDLDWNIDSQADVSTFHQIAPPPATPEENIVLRTHLRSYPALLYDLSGVPPNAFINRADLVLHTDSERSYGNLQNLVVSEYDTLNFGGAIHDIRLAQLDAAIDYMVTAVTSHDPKNLKPGIKFNVTSLIQRQINRVEGADPGLVITGGESFAAIPTQYWSAMGPGYWLTEFRFFGLAAADSLRPRLEISYSVLEELGVGNE